MWLHHAGKKLLVIWLLMMGVATFAIGLPPGYATIGVLAPILLVSEVLGVVALGMWTISVTTRTPRRPPAIPLRTAPAP